MSCTGYIFWWLQCENSPIRENTIHHLICTKTCFNRDIRKARKRHYQNPEFGQTQGGMKKHLQKDKLAFKSFFFPDRLHCCDIDFHCSYVYS